MCIIPYQGLLLCLFFLTLSLMALFCGVIGMEDFEGILASHILLSRRPDPKEKQVINLDQDVQVWMFLVDGIWTPFV